MADKITISLPEELVEKVNDQLDYGDNRSAWIREAIEMRFEAEGVEGNGNGTTETTESMAD